MGETFPDTASSPKPPEDRLDSWKEIATYLNRDVTTVQRWEKREGMPVHRHVHDKLGSVYASRFELDAWARSRNPGIIRNGTEAEALMAPPADRAAVEAVAESVGQSQVSDAGGLRAQSLRRVVWGSVAVT